MKKRDQRQIHRIVQELYLAYLRDALSRGVDLGPPCWAEVHPFWQLIFYAQARKRLQDEKQDMARLKAATMKEIPA